MSPTLESTDARNKLEDLSGIKIAPGENPYEALIKACNNDPVRKTSSRPVDQIAIGIVYDLLSLL